MALVLQRRADSSRDPGAQAVGSDHEPCFDPDRLARAVVADDPIHPTRAVTGDAGDGDPGPHVRPTLGGGLHQDVVEHVAAGVEQVGHSRPFTATANGARISFTRDVAVVASDLDDVETIDLGAAGGADTITVNNLTGTDLTTVITNLAAFGGSSDGAADHVIVNGTGGDDVIGLLDDGARVVVDGLPTHVWIGSADATLDHLSVNGLEGTDTITPTPGASELIGLTLVQ